jgi:RNA polymerase sigma factor (sigma-70 family)
VSTAALATFEDLVARHQVEVLRVCRTILRDEHLGADAAQETFVRLWRRIAEGREPEKTSAWLRRVAVSTSLDLARTRIARKREAQIAETLADTRTVAPDAGEWVERFERALAELSDGQRTVFLLRHEGGMALSEVAETLGVSLPTVKTQFARACLKLQEKLAKFRPEGRPDRRRTT